MVSFLLGEPVPHNKKVVGNTWNGVRKCVAASRMMELTTRFPQQFATTAWKTSFTFLPFDIQLI
jgi:hypothetical protein